MWYRIEVELPQHGHEIRSAEDLLGKLLGGEVRLVAVRGAGEEGEGVGVSSSVGRQQRLLTDGDDAQTNVEALRRAWNELKHETQPAWSDSAGRARLVKRRLRDRPSIEQWRIIIKRIAASDFCRGKNDRGWVANPDFLLRVDTGTKTLEGQYDNRAPASAAPAYVKPKGHYSTDPLTLGMWVADK